MSRYGQAGQFRKAFHVFVIRRLKATLGLYFFSGKNPKSKAEQYQELKTLLASEPYRTAIAQVEPEKLQNRYDKMLWQAAKATSPKRIHFVFQLSVLAKKLKH
jgi:hypothetical protein